MGIYSEISEHTYDIIALVAEVLDIRIDLGKKTKASTFHTRID